MTRNKRLARSHALPSATAAAPASDPFDRILFGMLLALIPLRTIINETATFEVARMFRHVQVAGNANPGTTFLFALAIALIACVAGIRRLARGGPRYLWTGGEIGLALLTVAGSVSVAIAGQKHLALIGAVNFITLILYGFTLRQYLTRPWRIRLALIVISGTAAVVLAKGAFQYFVEHPDTIQYYEEHKTELLGPDADAATGKGAGMRYDYEQRMLSRLVSAYYPHANVLGSHLILFIAASASLIGDRLLRIRRKLISPLTLMAPTLIIAGCFVALVGTDSKGAVACGALVIALWVLGSLLSRAIRKHPGMAAVVVWATGIAGVIGLVFLLNSNEAALGKSIQFRSMYWRGAVALIADDHVLGVGPLNFGRHFLRYKPVECPEEVESPHSWIVQLAAEWGVPGLAAFLILLAGITWRLTHPRTRPVPNADHDPPGSIIWWPIAIGGGVFAYWMYQHLGEPVDALVLSLFIAAVPWLLGAVLVGFESANDSDLCSAPVPGMLPAIIAGLLCFLLHTGIDLALFEGGPATTFFAMAAIALAIADVRAGEDSEPDAATSGERIATPRAGLAKGLGIATAALAVIAFAQLVVRPFACFEALQSARIDTEPTPWNPYLSVGGGSSYLGAVDAYALDATATTELAEQLIPRVRSVGNADELLALVDELAQRDPYNGVHHNLRGTVYSQKYQMTHDAAFLRDAAKEYDRYVADYPTSPSRHIYAANLHTMLARDTDDMDARATAIEHLETALSLDEQRIYVSKPNRLPPEQIEQIRLAIAQLRDAASTPPATRPATSD